MSDYYAYMSIKDLCKKYAFSTTKLYNLLDTLGKTRRRSLPNFSYATIGITTELYIRHKQTTYTVLIDTEDLSRVLNVSRYWCVARKKGGYKYVQSTHQTGTYLHRFIMQAGTNELVDHVNHNTLDNRKINLRICSCSENMQNRKGGQIGSHIPIRGVFIHTDESRAKRYYARVTVNKYTHHLGYFYTPQEAEIAVIRARKKLMPYSEMDK